MSALLSPNFIDQAVEEARFDFSKHRDAIEYNFNRWPRYTPEHEAYEQELERLTYEGDSRPRSLDGQLSLFRKSGGK